MQMVLLEMFEEKPVSSALKIFFGASASAIVRNFQIVNVLQVYLNKYSTYGFQGNFKSLVKNFK